MAIVEVLKYDGRPDMFAWKYPNNELGTWTQLIVNETQEAVFLKGGTVCDVFGPGHYTLDTENIPILRNIINIPFGGRSPFSAEVWFINKAYALDIKWGTPSPIQLQDPKYKIFAPVRAFGQFGIRIEDSRNFLLKLVGTLPRFDTTAILKYFRGVYITKAKDVISSYLVHKGISILEVNAYLDEMSNYLRERIAPTFAEYGITMTSFYVSDVNVPEDDPAVQQLKKALAKRAEMDIVGYSYQQERSFDTLEGAATNQGSGQSTLMGAGIGLGMGVGVGGAMGTQFGGLTQNINVADKVHCPKCNSLIGAHEQYCHVCGFNTTEKKGDKTKGVNPAIKCASCGTELTETAKFCPECGKKYNPCKKCKADLPDGVAKCPVCGEAIPKTCPSCGTLISSKTKFCPECGYSFVRKCMVCGNELKDTFKVCPECGTPVRGESDE